MLKRSAIAVTMLALLAGAQAANGQARNVFLMISDGIGFNGWQASSYYLYEQGSGDWEDALPYGPTAGFDMYGSTHYADGGSYDPDYVWASFKNHMNGATDSAAAATALYSGVKTYSGAIGMGPDRQPVTLFGEIAAAQGKATGAVSSVQYNHATPGAVDAHNVSRGNYGAIAEDMFTSDLDVIMGGDSKDPWDADEAVLAVENGFEYIHDASDFVKLANGTYKNGNIPTKLAGSFNGSTLDGRDAPTLKQMTQGALRVLEQDPDGMFMMVESGAVDWNNHGNNMEAMLREQEDFDNSVKVVMEWIENNGGYEENLLIVTSDHETGSIWGELPEGFDENGDVFPQIEDKGVGNMPGHSYNSGGHTNHLVPLFAKGVGSELFESLVDGTDTESGAFWGFDGQYVDNTDVFTVMNGATTIPEPTTMALLGIGGLLAIRRRRNR
ncbi:MAG: alkaline phosphatase [Planctomycetota bacterium]